MAWRRAPAPAVDAEVVGCGFLGRSAWVAVVVEGNGHASFLRVERTRDGGRTWRSARLGAHEPRWTTWAGGPAAQFRFLDARHGSLEVRDGAQHHNGHIETRAWYATRDGGATWRLVRKRRRCAGPKGSCGHG